MQHAALASADAWHEMVVTPGHRMAHVRLPYPRFLVEAGPNRTARYLVRVHTALELEEVAYYRNVGWRVTKLWRGGLSSLRRRIAPESEESEEESEESLVSSAFPPSENIGSP